MDFKHFNPRTPYGMRRFLSLIDVCLPLRFQSTHPLRDATVSPTIWFAVGNISIHAPLTGCDHNRKHTRYTYSYFNPRTPYGMRPVLKAQSKNLNSFQSTHPLRDATIDVSFTSPPYNNFNPRTPYGMRRYLDIDKVRDYQFQSTHPLRDAT